MNRMMTEPWWRVRSTREGGNLVLKRLMWWMRAWALGLDLLLSSLEASFGAQAVLEMHGFEREGRASRDTRLCQATTVSARDSPDTNRIFDRATRPDALTKLNIVRVSILAALIQRFPICSFLLLES